MAELPILVAGGGIGGLAVALALAAIGRRVEVLERAPEPTTDGAGIQLGPNAVTALRRLGVADRLAADAVSPSALAVTSGIRPAALMRMPLGATIEARCGAPYWTVRRAHLHGALLHAASETAAITLTYGADVHAISDEPSRAVTVSCADGHDRNGAALIGADGVWSRVRSAIAPPEFGLQPSGHSAYRAIIPADQAIAAGLDTTVVGAWLSPETHVVHYAIDAGRAVNLVVVARDGRARAGWNASATAAEISAATRSLPSRLRSVFDAAPAWHTWSLPLPVALPEWHRGRVALAGDAAHAMLPFFAQGGAMALEDAVVLAGCVERASDLTDAFAAYHAKRRGRVARVQQASIRNGRVFHLQGALATARDTTLRMTPPALFLRSFDWLYRYDAAAV